MIYKRVPPVSQCHRRRYDTSLFRHLVKTKFRKPNANVGYFVLRDLGGKADMLMSDPISWRTSMPNSSLA